jgi:hypothetical protein
MFPDAQWQPDIFSECGCATDRCMQATNTIRTLLYTMKVILMLRWVRVVVA